MKARFCMTSKAVSKREIDYYYKVTAPSLIDLMTIEEEGSGVLFHSGHLDPSFQMSIAFYISVKIQPLLRFIETGIKDEEVQQPLSEPMKELRSQTKRKALYLFACQE